MRRRFPKRRGFVSPLGGQEYERLVRLPDANDSSEEYARNRLLITTRSIQPLLARQIAREAISAEVRRAMLKYFSNTRVFEQIARHDPDERVRVAAKRLLGIKKRASVQHQEPKWATER